MNNVASGILIILAVIFFVFVIRNFYSPTRKRKAAAAKLNREMEKARDLSFPRSHEERPIYPTEEEQEETFPPRGEARAFREGNVRHRERKGDVPRPSFTPPRGDGPVMNLPSSSAMRDQAKIQDDFSKGVLTGLFLGVVVSDDYNPAPLELNHNYRDTPTPDDSRGDDSSSSSSSDSGSDD